MENLPLATLLCLVPTPNSVAIGQRGWGWLGRVQWRDTGGGEEEGQKYDHSGWLKHDHSAWWEHYHHGNVYGCGERYMGKQDENSRGEMVMENGMADLSSLLAWNSWLWWMAGCPLVQCVYGPKLFNPKLLPCVSQSRTPSEFWGPIH